MMPYSDDIDETPFYADVFLKAHEGIGLSFKKNIATPETGWLCFFLLFRFLYVS